MKLQKLTPQDLSVPHAPAIDSSGKVLSVSLAEYSQALHFTVKCKMERMNPSPFLAFFMRGLPTWSLHRSVPGLPALCVSEAPAGSPVSA